MSKKPNRLGIDFLLLWIATTGALLAMLKWRFESAGLSADMLEQIQFRQLLFCLLVIPFHGLGLAGLLYIVCSRWRGNQLVPTEPGHWILVNAGARELLNLVVDATTVGLLPGDDVTPRSIFYTYLAISALGSASLIAIAIPSTRGGIVWRASIAAMLLTSATLVLESSIAMRWLPQSSAWLEERSWRHINYLFFSLPGLLAIAGSVMDRRTHMRRDFLHWCGVGVVVLVPLGDVIVRLWANGSLFP